MNADAVVELISNLRLLEKKYAFRKSINIFEAAGLSRQEIRHSRMLSFLLDPTRNHGLEASIIKNILVAYHQDDFPSIAHILLSDLSDAVVLCEWRNIDILISSPSLKIVIAIENKIDARESMRNGLSQLSKYSNIIEADPVFENYSKLFVYLTPDGDEPSDSRWQIMLYSDVLEYVEKAFEEMHGESVDTNSTTAKFVIKQYIDFLKRSVVMDPELAEDCKIIYRKHREILDVLFSIVKVNQDGEFSDAGNLFAEQNNSTIYSIRSDSKIAFLPNQLVSLLPDNLDRLWWEQRKPIICLLVYAEPKVLKLLVQVGPMTDKSTRAALVEGLRSIFNHGKNRQITDMYTNVYSYKISINEDNPDLANQMNSIFVPFKSKLDQISSVVASILKS